MRQQNPDRSALYVARCGMLCAVALMAAAVEQLLPALPMLPPGVKPGVANLAVMAAAELLGSGAAMAAVAVKAAFALATRGAMAGAMSLAGGLLSGAVMIVLLRCGWFGTVGVGVAGAAAHHCAQLAVASALLTGGYWNYLPILLLLAIPAGIVTGGLYGGIRYALFRAAGR